VSSSATAVRVPPSVERPRKENRVLVVSEDPFFIEEARAVLSCCGARVIGCLGPAHSDCDLYVKGSCALAASAAVAVVDAPRSGAFRYHHVDIGAAEYGEALQHRHPETHIILCGGREGSVGPTGEIAVTKERHEALYVLTRMLRANEERTAP
jgi:hypothetical protein